MSTVAARSVGLPPARVPKAAIVAGVSVLSAAAAVWLRRDVTLPFPTFVGACQRLRASGLAITGRDWFCRPIPAPARISYAVALLLVAVALVVPSAALAATGRRWWSLLPLVVAPWFGSNGLLSSGEWWKAGHGGSLGVAINVVVLAAPVAAIWAVTPGRGGARWPAWVAALLAGAFCFAATCGVFVLTRALFEHHWAAIGGFEDAVPGVIPAMMVMALFGLVLGVDRRWWPWSLAPVALLVSGAPAAALIWNPEGLRYWSGFGLVLPLATIGLIWSAAAPTARFLSTRIDGREPDEPLSAGRPADRPLRPAVVLNAIAVGIVASSLIAFASDPYPVQIGVALPTYLGAQIQAQDVRAKLDLRRAIGAMDGYAETHGGYPGFDAAAGRTVDPGLAWSDRATEGTGPALTIAIVATSADTARVATTSESGAAFCIERADGSLRYGTAPAGPGALATAIARCGSTAWSAEAVRRLDVAGFCDGVDRGGYLLCRMVQVLIVDTMNRPGPVAS
jgi:hypothetical protein